MEPIKVKKLREGAILPTYGTPYSAGADLYACLNILAQHAIGKCIKRI